MLALEPGWKSFLFMNLANILLFSNRLLGKDKERKLGLSIARHLELLARKGKWDIYLSLVPGPLDLVDKQHVGSSYWF